MSTQPAASPLPNAAEGEQGIDLLAALVAVVAEWRLILSCAAIVFVLSLAGILLMTPQFVGTARILSTAGHSDSDTLSAIFYGARAPGALYADLLKSRGVLDDVIDRAGLMQVWHAKDRQSARDRLSTRTTVTADMDALVTIEVRDPDAHRAAQITNAYLDSLQALNERLSQSESEEKRQFFDTQLQQERERLNNAEADLARTKKSTGLVDPTAQTQLGLSAIQAVRAQITSLEVQLAALLQRETEQAPDVQNIRSQIRQLRAEEQRMESSSAAPVGAAPAAGRLPESSLDYQRAQRDVREHELVVQSLASQYESARLAEGAGRSAFQIVDRAVPPERKSWPPRRALVILAFVLAGLCGIFAAGLRLVFRRLRADPVSRTHLSRLRTIFRRA